MRVRQTQRSRRMGEHKLFFDDVSEGDTAPPFAHELTRTDLVAYAGASGDFNPMHHDEVQAMAAGLPSVFGHGMFTMGLLGKALTDYVGVGNLERYSVRFTQQTWPGEMLTTQVSIARKFDQDGAHKVELACAVVNQDGAAKVQGTAVAVLPAR